MRVISARSGDVYNRNIPMPFSVEFPMNYSAVLHVDTARTVVDSARTAIAFPNHPKSQSFFKKHPGVKPK